MPRSSEDHRKEAACVSIEDQWNAQSDKKTQIMRVYRKLIKCGWKNRTNKDAASAILSDQNHAQRDGRLARIGVLTGC
jgi:hypothetical protein